jgi:predicted permease
VYRHRVSPGYFATLGSPLLRGRDFGPGDTGDEAGAVILSARLAARLWPDQDPVGRRLKPGPPDADAPWMTVVGVAGDLRHRTLFDDPERAPTDPDLYLPFAAGGTFTVVARTRTPPPAAIPELRSTVARLHPDAVPFDFQPMSERVGRQTAGSRFASLLMGGFAVLALTLAAIGLYGVMAFAVAQRTTEIGIRMALGARRGSVLGRVMGQGMALVGAGAAVGLVLALALGGLAGRLLYGVAPTDPGVLAATAGLLAAVAAAACWVPAHRACRVDPIVALRHE